MAKGLERDAIAAFAEGLRIDPEGKAGHAAMVQAFKLRSPAMRALIWLHQFLSRFSAVALFMATCTYAQMERYPSVRIPMWSADRFVVVLLFCLFAIVIFAKPVSDLYVLLFAVGRRGLSSEARQVAATTVGIAALYAFIVLVAVIIEPARPFVPAMFVLLIAAIPAFSFRLMTWNRNRLAILSLLLLGPLLVFAPLLATGVLPESLSAAIPQRGAGLVAYQGILGIVLMISIYWLESTENALLRVR